MPSQSQSARDDLADLLRRAEDLLDRPSPDVAGARAAIAAARALQESVGARPDPDPDLGVESPDELLGVVAHELRNPVSPMVFQVEYMMMQVEQGGDSVAAAWVLGELEGLRRRLDAFVGSLDRLLDASQLSSGTLRMEREPVDLVALAREVAAAAADQARAGGSRIRVSADQERLVGLWDRLRVEQVVRNLVSNAIRYAAGGDIDIDVTADQARARVTVRDRGPGIAPDKLEHIFDRFARASAKSGGFGIGLWLVKRVCQALGGEVQVESRPGEGASFSIFLPRDPRSSNESTT